MGYLISIVSWILQIYYYLLIARILMSWVPEMERTAVGRLLYRLTEPYLGIFRRFIPPLYFGGAGIDFSPIVAFLVYWFVINYAIFPLLGRFIQWIGFV